MALDYACSNFDPLDWGTRIDPYAAYAALRAAGPVRNEANRRKLQRWYREGILSPGISAEFSLHEGGKVIQLFADRSAVGKVVVTI